MEMVRQDHPSINVEGPLSPSTCHRFAQRLDVAHRRSVVRFNRLMVKKYLPPGTRQRR
jgi:hypothetical protein